MAFVADIFAAGTVVIAFGFAAWMVMQTLKG
jgi:hypothetical protein